MLQRLRKVTAAAVIAGVPLLTLLTPGMAHAAVTGNIYKWTGASSSTSGLNGCTLNCWSVAGNWSVSTNGGTSYATATNAPASADNSGAGDNLVFDNAALSSASVTTTNDIGALTVANVATTGTNSGFRNYTVAGAALTITGGVGASTGPSVVLTDAVTFAGDQAYGVADSGAAVSLGSATSVTVASGTLTAAADFTGNSMTIASGANLIVNDGANIYGLAGSGSITVVTPSGQFVNQTNNLYLGQSGSANTFSGTIDLQKGAVLNINTQGTTNGALGTAALTIEDGAQLNINDSPNPAAETDTITIPNAITMGGSGAGVDQMTQGAIIAGMYDQAKNETAGTLTVNLTGAVTLTSNTVLASTFATATTYNFTGAFTQGGFTLGAVTAVQPTYGVSTVQVNGKTVAGGVAAPKTPDTGFSLSAAHPAETLMITLLGAGFIMGAAVKFRRPAAHTARRR